jgi:hypothetical protein
MFDISEKGKAISTTHVNSKFEKKGKAPFQSEAKIGALDSLPGTVQLKKILLAKSLIIKL